MTPTKSYVVELSRVAENLFRDAAAAYPDLESEFERDLFRLRALVKARGLAVYLLDMPAVCKHLDRCLSTSQYTKSGLPLTRRVSQTVVVPKFLRGLYLLVFDERGCLRPDCDVTAVVFLRQILLVGKKATVACRDEDVAEEIRSFLEVDESLSAPPKEWDSDDPYSVQGNHDFGRDSFYWTRFMGAFSDKKEAFDLVTNLDKTSRLVCSLLGDYTPRMGSTRHGPGAVSERTGSVNKYRFVNWSDRLSRVFPYEEFAFHSYSSWAAHDHSDVLSYEAPSRLIAVPKTLDRPRLIAAEPTEHQWCQQSIWRHLDTRVGATALGKFLDFHSQELNQRLCLEGSASGTLSTLDLSSASDRVSCRIVQSVFWRLPGLLAALHATRTRWVEVPINGGFCYRMRKFATMGSACTFPVESIIFLTVALAAYFTKRRLPVTAEGLDGIAGQVAVFGDDIIVPEDIRELCVRTLELLEFKVNDAKCFTEGNFRESCGVDAFRGVQVTPAHWMAPNTGKPESVASTVAVHNNFHKRWLMHTARYIASTVRNRDTLRVPANSGVFGLKTFAPIPPTAYRRRWNEKLHRYEIFAPHLVVKVQKIATNDDSALLQYFTERPSPLSKWKSGVAQRPRLKVRSGWVDESLLLLNN